MILQQDRSHSHESTHQLLELFSLKCKAFNDYKEIIRHLRIIDATRKLDIELQNQLVAHVYFTREEEAMALFFRQGLFLYAAVTPENVKEPTLQSLFEGGGVDA